MKSMNVQAKMLIAVAFSVFLFYFRMNFNASAKNAVTFDFKKMSRKRSFDF